MFTLKLSWQLEIKPHCIMPVKNNWTCYSSTSHHFPRTALLNGIWLFQKEQFGYLFLFILVWRNKAACSLWPYFIFKIKRQLCFTRKDLHENLKTFFGELVIEPKINRIVWFWLEYLVIESCLVQTSCNFKAVINLC